MSTANANASSLSGISRQLSSRETGRKSPLTPDQLIKLSGLPNEKLAGIEVLEARHIQEEESMEVELAGIRERDAIRAEISAQNRPLRRYFRAAACLIAVAGATLITTATVFRDQIAQAMTP
jgi:hypothetical protein